MASVPSAACYAEFWGFWLHNNLAKYLTKQARAGEGGGAGAVVVAGAETYYL